MAHVQQLKFINLVNEYFVNPIRNRSNPIRILEIGSYILNGSPRDFLEIENTEYVGVDLCAGKGVDVVSFGHKLDLGTATFDFVLSCECFEHDPHWIETFKNMYRMAKVGSIVAFTCASKGRLEHGTTRTNPDHSPGTQHLGIDYYKNLTENDFYNAFDINNLFQVHFFFFEKTSHDLYFVGIKTENYTLNLNREAFVLEVMRIKKLAKFRPKLYEVPVYFARYLLPEQVFQNFAASYLKAVKPINKIFRTLKR